MNLSPPVNRSFLHKNKRTSNASDKVVYITVNSLALRRARLPLQLLPTNADNDIETSAKVENEEKVLSDEYQLAKAASEADPTQQDATKTAVLASQSRTCKDVEVETIKQSECNQELDNNVNRKTDKDIPNEEIVESIDTSKEFDRTIKRSSSSSSSDYEKVEATSCVMMEFSEIPELANGQSQLDLSKRKNMRTKKVHVKSKSKSMSDISPQNSFDHSKEERYFYAKAEESFSSEDEENNVKMRKHRTTKRFTKNVFRYMSGYLVKRHRKSSKKKKKLSLSASLNSVESLELKSDCPTFRNQRNSLFKEEFKYLMISPPSNFVHVASATNPRLVSNENTVRSSLEQAVITHEEKCANLPLLVQEKYQNAEDVDAKRAAHDSTLASFKDEELSNNKDKESTCVKVPNEIPSSAQTRAVEVLELSQPVKSIAENQDSPDEKKREANYEAMSVYMSTLFSRAAPRTNSSFLWSNQTKNFLNREGGAAFFRKGENQFLSLNSSEEVLNEDYDDVGALADPENYYDDVGPSRAFANENELTSKTPAPCNIDYEDTDGIYDDVVTLSLNQVASPITGGEENCHRIAKTLTTNVTPQFADVKEHVTNKRTSNERIESVKSMIDSTNLADPPDYISVNNYCNIADEDYEKYENQTEEQSVYDDVGLPREERINSLYGGSIPVSIFGAEDHLMDRPVSTNDNESEWEDLEVYASVSSHSSRRNAISERSFKLRNSRKRCDSRWSKRTKREKRSRKCRKNSKSSVKFTRDSAVYVAVSLGSGSVLSLLPYPGKEDGKVKEKSTESFENSHSRSQGLVQMRLVNLHEDEDMQETSCYVYEESASEDSTYESLNSCHLDNFSMSSEKEDTKEMNNIEQQRKILEQESRSELEAPTRSVPPPPRESSLSQTLGKRIKMLRRTWSITKGSLGRMRKKNSIDEEHYCEENNKSVNEPETAETAKYMHFNNFKRHLKRNLSNFTGLSTFYLNENNDIRELKNSDTDSSGKSALYRNTNWYTWFDPAKNTNDAVDCYTALTKHEPLYQFYTAATTRIAIESDSDDYEDSALISKQVQDLYPSAAATELVKAGYRTLWSHTSQVINSGLLQKLSVEEKKLQEAKFEILTSEASYLNSLRVLKKEFLDNHELVHEVLSPSEKERLFGGITEILLASEKFLADLEIIWARDLMLHALPEVLLKHAENSLHTFVNYCSNQVRIDMTLKDLRTKKDSKFSEIVSSIETRPACQNLSLHSFLMLPMQRVTRLPLLADAILSKLPMSHEDRSQWEKVLSTLSYVAAECNEGARAAAQEAEMEILERILEYSLKIKPITLRGRYLVRKGSLVQLSMKTDAEYKLTFGKKFNKTPLHLFLLTDYLLVTKIKHNANDETYNVIDMCKRNLLALESVSEDSPFAGRNAIMLTLLENHCGRHVEYILTCENNTERERWLEAVSPPKQEIVGETLYEAWDCPQVTALYSYTPTQPDELTLQPGDVINVLRKMTDGWYHGEKLLNGEQGWFPGNYTKEVASEHVRARNLKQRHRLLALTGSVLLKRAKQNLVVH